jgi:hypothetical protein
MYDDLTKFLKGFYKSLLKISNGGALSFNHFIDSVQKGDLSFISINTVVKSEQDDLVLESIEKHLDHLGEINRRPRKYLQTEEVVRPVELSKNINTRTIYELSKNSSHWRRIKIDGVEPSKLLTEMNEDDYEIYENRIYKTLVDRLVTILDRILIKNIQLKENVKNADTINSNLVNNHKSARLFLKIAPNELENLNNISITTIKEKIEKIKKLSKRISFLRSSSLYQMLRKTKDVISPLNMTNILLQERNYKGMVELWADIEKYSVTLADGASEEGELLDVTDSHYALYVYLFGLIVINEMDYTKQNDYIGKISDFKLSFCARTGVDEITYELHDERISITFCEIQHYHIPLKEYAYDFFKNVLNNPNIKVKNKNLIFNNLVDKKQINDIEELYKDYINNASKKAEKRKRFNNEILNQMRSLLRNKYDKKSIVIDVDTKEIDEGNAALLSYSNELLDKLVENRREKDGKTYYYVLPKIQVSKDFIIKDYIYRRFNNIGENYNFDYDAKYVNELSNYRGGVFMVTYDNLVSLTRFMKMINVHRFGLGSVNKTLEEECPICGGRSINCKGLDYSCNVCKSIWSKSKCNFCGHEVLFIRENNKDISSLMDIDSVNELYDRLDLERGPMAFTSGDFIDSKFKTVCSNCGKVMG